MDPQLFHPIVPVIFVYPEKNFNGILRNSHFHLSIPTTFHLLYLYGSFTSSSMCVQPCNCHNLSGIVCLGMWQTSGILAKLKAKKWWKIVRQWYTSAIVLHSTYGIVNFWQFLLRSVCTTACKWDIKPLLKGPGNKVCLQCSCCLLLLLNILDLTKVDDFVL